MYSETWSNWCILGLKVAFNNVVCSYTQYKGLCNGFNHILEVDHTDFTTSLLFTTLI